MSEKKILVQFQQDFGRMGALEGLFITTPEVLNAAMGETAHFGEALGKHSDVWAQLNVDQFQVLTDDQGFIKQLEVIVLGRVDPGTFHLMGYRTVSGWCPLEYVDEE